MPPVEPRDAKALADYTIKLVAERQLPDPTSEIALSWSRTLARHLYDVGVEHDEEANNNMFDFVSDLATIDGALSSYANSLLESRQTQLAWLWQGAWAHSGFPRVVMDDRYAALLMATDTGKEALEFVRPPWSAFLVQLPENLLTVVDPWGKRVSLRFLLVHRVTRADGEQRWDFLTHTPCGLELWRYGMTTEQLIDLSTFNPVTSPNRPWEFKIESEDERTLFMLGRLIISTCLAMSDPRNLHEQKKTKGRGPKFCSKDKPSVRTYVLHHQVTVDCRPFVREYTQNGLEGSRTLSVRRLVRGHWRMQPHGPKSSLRKLIHVEAFWRGPESGDLSIGPHVLKGD